MSTTREPSSDEREQAQVTGHEYDGILEYDNPMPTWWTRLFWATFVFSIGYYFHYQLSGNGATVEDTYEAEMREHRDRLAAAALGHETTEASLTHVMQDPALMKDARVDFVRRCVQCHADRGQGNIGPNLTDDHWIYGSATLMELLEIISNGRPQKGMPTWSRVLSPVELAELAAYVGTLRNTNVPGRPPQGTKVATATEAATDGSINAGATGAAGAPAQPPAAGAAGTTAQPPVAREEHVTTSTVRSAE
jgi:cytochrome c oxidase cbb3-type subunit III